MNTNYMMVIISAKFLRILWEHSIPYEMNIYKKGVTYHSFQASVLTQTYYFPQCNAGSWCNTHTHTLPSLATSCQNTPTHHPLLLGLHLSFTIKMLHLLEIHNTIWIANSKRLKFAIRNTVTVPTFKQDISTVIFISYMIIFFFSGWAEEGRQIQFQNPIVDTLMELFHMNTQNW